MHRTATTNHSKSNRQEKGVKNAFTHPFFKPLVVAVMLLFSFTFSGNAQQIRLDNLKEQYSKKSFMRVNGGVSANAVFYDGNNPNRDPFTWVLSGNVNFSFFNQLNLPFTFNLNNLGGSYTYPTMPNRLSIHPSYKWITGHIGDVSMSFSPYTLGGHQFTGVGVELSPDNFPVKVSAMYGRLLKATEYKPEERLGMPAYKRMGYGAKVLYDKEKYSIGMSLFGARDHNSSVQIPDSLDLLPHSNLAMSWEAGFRLIKNLSLTAEYGLSILVRDNRLPSSITKSSYHAFKAGLSYQLMKNTIGFGYERIDPEYQSLGAYYFTNDLENFTFSFARPFFKDKLTMALNVGIQHDNLDNNKSEQTNRFVGAANISYNHNENLSASFSFSTFQTYTNIKSQFDYINGMTNYDNLDTLDYTQLSQNINLNVSWNFGKSESKKHSLNVNLSFQEAADKRGGITRTGGASQFYNLATSYGLLFVPQSLRLTASANVTYSTIGTNEMITYGPSLGAVAKLFKKKLTTGASVSYNVSVDDGRWQNSVVNFRWNAAYQFLKRHNLSIVLIEQSRNMKARPTTNDFTTTLSYSYSF
ncbi:MAG: hypothetical protein LBG19_05190 [Prevotellaceae bacterium]|jgi:hypothetical protein|nr:hypothetical protein [Prevotellaceae bacterium]